MENHGREVLMELRVEAISISSNDFDVPLSPEDIENLLASFQRNAFFYVQDCDMGIVSYLVRRGKLALKV